jgi:uncharacterized MAPEG superfamily protein
LKTDNDDDGIFKGLQTVLILIVFGIPGFAIVMGASAFLFVYLPIWVIMTLQNLTGIRSFIWLISPFVLLFGWVFLVVLWDSIKKRIRK